MEDDRNSFSLMRVIDMHSRHINDFVQKGNRKNGYGARPDVFKGHRKAVSYVKFLNSTDIVSASTDSQLKLWNVNQKNCIRSFTGTFLFIDSFMNLVLRFVKLLKTLGTTKNIQQLI